MYPKFTAQGNYICEKNIERFTTLSSTELLQTILPLNNSDVNLLLSQVPTTQIRDLLNKSSDNVTLSLSKISEIKDGNYSGSEIISLLNKSSSITPVPNPSGTPVPDPSGTPVPISSTTSANIITKPENICNKYDCNYLYNNKNIKNKCESNYNTYCSYYCNLK